MKKYRLKILTTGDAAVGKTTFLKRYTSGKFVDNLKLTIGVDFFSKNLQVHDTLCNLVIWDFEGQAVFRDILPSYVEGAHGALFMFSLPHAAKTLKNVESWWSILNKEGSIPILLIGTKSDLITEYDVSLYNDLVIETREKYNFVDYIETSSKTGQNIDEAVEMLVSFILKNTP